MDNLQKFEEKLITGKFLIRQKGRKGGYVV